jgi:hypothetical protein
MHIIFGEDRNNLPDNYTILELDRIRSPGGDQAVTAYCVVENIPLGDFPAIDAYIKVHHDMMQAYRDQNWEYVETAINGLTGKWNGELDSFYQILYDRVSKLKEQTLDDSWDGSIEKSLS